ncbi:AMP-binding protein [Hydrogenophaga crocea]|uniref:acetate--CoA ligase n=1 Tax=Hydrogenophaga crocea TaxID=2716225 RepID=A0A6G8ICL7_9BURK|nr:AMP-binding protein [Hydrogenophaga crocea]QIM50750.1 AMP-binding protein [Hydrogenophaga crocea]
MSAGTDFAWTPAPQTIERSNIHALCAMLGVRDYDGLHRLSLDDTFRFHQTAMRHLGFEWFRWPDALIAEGCDPRLPHWFAGGELNWVHNALRRGESDAGRHQIALICEQEDGRVQQLSYFELRQEALRKAAGLRASGIRRGDRVGLMLSMGKDAVVAFLAISALGAIAVPLFTGFGADAMVARLQACDARALITDRHLTRRGQTTDLWERLVLVTRQLPALRVVFITTEAPARSIAGKAVMPWSDVGRDQSIDSIEAMGANDPFMIVYTSGTTGRPKGAVHTHGGFPVKIVEDSAYHFDLKSGDRWLWPSDLGWIVGPITIVGALCLGATLVCYDGAPDHPDWSRMGAMIGRHQVTHFGASPTLLRGLMQNADSSLSAPRSDLQVLISAGEVLPEDVFDWYLNDFGNGRAPVINYTGGTEVSGAILGNVVTRPIKASGFNAASLAADVVAYDDAGLPCRNTVGELVIRRPFVGMTHGFWQEPERYFDAYWSQFPDVWTHGDLLLQDADGHSFIKGRSDDTLKIAGKRVGPAEVEEVARIQGVRDIAAVGLSDDVKGQRLVLVVVPESPSLATPELAQAVATAVRAGLGKPFAPASIHWIEMLPKTRNGKVLRRMLRRALENQALGDTSSLESTSMLMAVERLRASVFGPPPGSTQEAHA